MRISIGSDHAGFDLKTLVIKEFSKQYEFIDVGTSNSEISVDYPDFTYKASDLIIKNKADFGILICGSGIGVSIAANRFSKIRAALCSNQKTVKLARQHNNANILCLGARALIKENALKMVKIFLTTNFEGSLSGGKRHLKRVEKLSKHGDN
ncbi:MAG: ribose 5-phosphate isomerase B [Lentimonas sp.]|jgi:ribose 5-phosphate isomerase B